MWLRGRMFSAQYLAHQIMAAFGLAETAKDASIKIIAEGSPFDLSMVVKQE